MNTHNCSDQRYIIVAPPAYGKTTWLRGNTRVERIFGTPVYCANKLLFIETDDIWSGLSSPDKAPAFELMNRHLPSTVTMITSWAKPHLWEGAKFIAITPSMESYSETRALRALEPEGYQPPESVELTIRLFIRDHGGLESAASMRDAFRAVSGHLCSSIRTPALEMNDQISVFGVLRMVDLLLYVRKAAVDRYELTN